MVQYALPDHVPLPQCRNLSLGSAEINLQYADKHPGLISAVPLNSLRNSYINTSLSTSNATLRAYTL
ncbi:hypothetical protein EYC84_008353 [Monilinia fructicola]|uniref:Uncharacterized protein n=1 Tax=Monilinia fructicola TaxID=38448 RepID=A0A5M9JGM3_MONFR|nr:hypothetical protein EYC84_008353 [Monilinia fructicola]